jgi:aminoglycoside phosphotransferase (APT) family kinase protein
LESPSLIDVSLVRTLFREQFPQWAGLDVRSIKPGGWDNRSFRVGHELVARLPSDEAYASQVDKEHRWLPRLAPQLPLAIPTPVAMGVPGSSYPWRWSIYRWISGEMPDPTPSVAEDLARFLAALQAIDATGGPAPGAHNFHRGDDLRVYDSEVDRALAMLRERIDQRVARDLCLIALVSRWDHAPVWIHGDVGPGNLLARNGRLAAVIDFGNLGVGDPACDLAIAWAWFDGDARKEFRSTLRPDEATWLRARAWALWKALVVAAGVSPTNAGEYTDPIRVIDQCLSEP